MSKRHFVIGDCQVKPGVSLEHLSHIGQYIVDKQPEVIVCIGDFCDMESLSSYDKGKKSFEGRRYLADIAVGKVGMDLLLNPIREYNKKQVLNHHKLYKPRMVLTLGNHEQRIERVTENTPELDGVVSYDDLPYKDWEVIDYLKPIEIDGFFYVHYLANPFTGKPYSGTALNQLVKVGKSFVVGHKQILDVATRHLIDGSQQWGIVNGACYSHTEGYKGHQGNHHFRGCVMLNDVRDGNADLMLLSLDYFKRRYGN